MIKRNIKILSIFLIGLIFKANQALAVELDGLSDTATAAGYTGNLTKFSVAQIIGIVIQAALGLLGVVFLVLMIYGGYLWMTDRGNDQQVEKAKNTIQRAIIGLIIVLAAYAITVFVGNIITP